MKLPLAVSAGLLMVACSSPTSRNEEPSFASLLGRWMAVEDSTLVLEVSRVCCGSRSLIEGHLRMAGRSAPLKSGSNVNAYTIFGPDSGAKPFHVFEVFLMVESDKEGAICGLDGFAQDAAGKTEFTEPPNPGIARLRMAKSVFVGSTCKASQDSLVWEKQP